MGGEQDRHAVHARATVAPVTVPDLVVRRRSSSWCVACPWVVRAADRARPTALLVHRPARDDSSFPRSTTALLARRDRRRRLGGRRRFAAPPSSPTARPLRAAGLRGRRSSRAAARRPPRFARRRAAVDGRGDFGATDDVPAPLRAGPRSTSAAFRPGGARRRGARRDLPRDASHAARHAASPRRSAASRRDARLRHRRRLVRARLPPAPRRRPGRSTPRPRRALTADALRWMMPGASRTASSTRRSTTSRRWRCTSSIGFTPMDEHLTVLHVEPSLRSIPSRLAACWAHVAPPHWSSQR